MDKERRITVKVTETLHRQVRVRAAEMGLPMSDIVRELLELWVKGKIDLPVE
jgi:predicted DNA binding CopG/RHH family protein